MELSTTNFYLKKLDPRMLGVSAEELRCVATVETSVDGVEKSQKIIGQLK